MAAHDKLGKSKLLQYFHLLRHHGCPEQKPRGQFGAKAVAEAETILGVENNHLAIVARHPIDIAQPGRIIFRDVGNIAYQGREEPPRPLAIQLDELGIGDVANDVVILANDFARAAIQGFQLFVFARLVQHVGDPRGFHAVTVLMDVAAGESRFGAGLDHLVKPAHGILRPRLRRLRALRHGQAGGQRHRQQNHQPAGKFHRPAALLAGASELTLVSR